jgi:hypothetical protein
MSIQKRGAARTEIGSAIRQKEKTVGNKKKGRGWYFTQDGTAHPSPVHNPPFQKDEAISFM